MHSKYLNKLISNEEHKRLAVNIFSLGILQGTNYILPLLTFPYLVRILGPDYFGLIAFATATTMYFVLITDYGFNLSATHQISIHRMDRNKVNEIFSSVMIIKTSLMVLSLISMLLLVFIFERFNQHWEVYIFSFGSVIGQLLFPVWLFQGMESMKYITYLNIVTKIFFTACIFYFVKEQSDYLLVPIITSLGLIMAGLWSLYIAKKKFNVSFIWQKTDSVKLQLFEGWYVFFSSIAISLYTVSLTFILGLLTNNTVLGYFSSADKIVQAFKGLYQPVGQAIFPLIGKKLHEDKNLGMTFVQKITRIVGFGMFLISIILFLTAESIVNSLLGNQYQGAIVLIQIMSPLPFIIALSNIYGIQTMVNLGYKKAFSRILIAAAFLGVTLSFLMVSNYKEIGTAITILLVECFVTASMFIYLKLYKRL